MSHVLAFDAVTCARGGRTLFAGLSFALDPGDALLVTGPNGVGKSSLVRVAAGLLRPAEGTVAANSARALLGETHALDAELPLERALAFWAEIDGRSDAVPEALAAFALTHIAHVPVRLLSTGQRKRAGLARVAASGASVWLLDEPANGLDAAGVTLLEQQIDRHRAAGGVVLCATHLPIALNTPQHIALDAAA